MDEQWARWILGGLGGVIALMFGEMIRRLFKRQDELEKSKANKESVDARFTEMQQTIRDHIQEDRDVHREYRDMQRESGQKLDAVVQQIGITNATLAGTNATLIALAKQVQDGFGANGQR